MSPRANSVSIIVKSDICNPHGKTSPRSGDRSIFSVMRPMEEDGGAPRPSESPKSRRSPTISGLTKLGWGEGAGGGAFLLGDLCGVAPTVVDNTGLFARLLGAGVRVSDRAFPCINNTASRNGGRYTPKEGISPTPYWRSVSSADPLDRILLTVSEAVYP